MSKRDREAFEHELRGRLWWAMFTCGLYSLALGGNEIGARMAHELAELKVYGFDPSRQLPPGKG